LVRFSTPAPWGDADEIAVRVRECLAAGADPSESTGDGVTPLHWAAAKGFDRAIEEMVRCGGNVNARSDLGASGLTYSGFEGGPLQTAVNHGRMSTALTLLGLGADPNLPSLAGDNPLVRAAAVGSGPLCQLLVDQGADPNFAIHCEPGGIYREGETALHTAVHNIQTEAVATLLRCGADPKKADASAISPLNLVLQPSLIRYRGLKQLSKEDLDQIRTALVG